MNNENYEYKVKLSELIRLIEVLGLKHKDDFVVFERVCEIDNEECDAVSIRFFTLLSLETINGIKNICHNYNLKHHISNPNHFLEIELPEVNNLSEKVYQLRVGITTISETNEVISHIDGSDDTFDKKQVRLQSIKNWSEHLDLMEVFTPKDVFLGELYETPLCFSMFEIDLAAGRLVRFLIEKNQNKWTNFSYIDVVYYYREQFWNEDMALYGLFGSYNKKGIVFSPKYIVQDNEGSLSVTEGFVKEII
jgi:hypothetical protein